MIAGMPSLIPPRRFGRDGDGHGAAERHMRLRRLHLRGPAAAAASGAAARQGMTPMTSASGPLDDVSPEDAALPMGGTDCACRCVYALEEDRGDTFVVYTDSETWAGNVHPVQALASTAQRASRPS